MNPKGAMPAYPEWRTIESAPEGVEVWTKIDDEHGVRNVQSMTRMGRLWHFPDMSMAWAKQVNVSEEIAA